MLMGRTTFDVVAAMEGSPWPYGDMPVFVATSRPLPPTASALPHVKAVGENVEDMLRSVRGAAGGKNVYVDGGALVRSCLEMGVVDRITIAIVPVVLGKGVSLFGGVEKRRPMRTVSHRSIGGGMVELVYDVEK